jgi:hypothetical protein
VFTFTEAVFDGGQVLASGIQGCRVVSHALLANVASLRQKRVTDDGLSVGPWRGSGWGARRGESPTTLSLSARAPRDGIETETWHSQGTEDRKSDLLSRAAKAAERRP